MDKVGACMLLGVFESSLDMRVAVTYERVLDFLRLLDSYNDMRGDAVAFMLAKIDAVIPRAQYGAGNPNNGNRTYTIQVGREGSPVLYLRRYVHTGDVPLDEKQIKAIEAAASEAKADEVSYKHERGDTTCGRANGRAWVEIRTIEPPLPAGYPDVGEEEFRFWWD